MANQDKSTTITFSEYNKLGKKQFELDFVDVPVNGSDVKLFIDPYSISRRKDLWFRNCATTIYTFFDHLLELIRLNKHNEALDLLDGLHESNETKLGYSPKNQGAAIGRKQSIKLYDSLRTSKAVETGILKDIEECNLMIHGIDRDKISDMTTNIIKKYLIRYTQQQCALHGVPIKKLPVKHLLNLDLFEWESDFCDLPEDMGGKAVVLVPKTIVRIIPALNAREYYQHYVLDFLQEEHYSAASSLCRVLKDKTLKKPAKTVITDMVTKVGNPKKDKGKKSLKDYLFEFSLGNKDVLQDYEDTKRTDDADPHLSDKDIEKNIKNRDQNYDDLIDKLNAVRPGRETANDYHEVMIGILSAIFRDLLTSPKKEDPINDGIKRIDIRFINSATYGFFSSLRSLKGIPAPYVYVECKNYFNDVVNPECDQLATRFSPERGRLGFLAIRKVDNRKKLIQRCGALAKDGHGYIIPITDEDVIQLIEFKRSKDNKSMDDFLEERLKEIID
ncbi:MAG: hypothetical protein LBL08_01115 [Candidatus Nomurabacteria bacterium]|jgi:hypothetical protein|nr:hypothetical protein [Candidatus Nomurabacteria bacterium]